jgi:hypothetical protein
MATKLVTNYQVKHCVTCDYWSGSRNVDNAGVVVSVSEPSIKGRCLGKWKPNSFTPNHTCHDFKKWGALK